MAKKSSDWQGRGVRIGREVMSEEEAADFVQELRHGVKDPEAMQEIEDFLSGRRGCLSVGVRDLLNILSLGLIMCRRKPPPKRGATSVHHLSYSSGGFVSPVFIACSI